MNFNKYILIVGPNQAELIKALQQFSNNYSDSGVTNGLELYKIKSENDLYVVNVSNDMDLEIFKYLVNYLHYPEYITYKIEVRGYWTIDKNDPVRGNHIGKRIMYYISPGDTEYDNVFGIFKGSDQTIKFGFAQRESFEIQEKKEIDFNERELSAEDFALIQTVHADLVTKKKNGKGCLLTFSVLFLAVFGLTLLIL